jgi:hypothetical protein
MFFRCSEVVIEEILLMPGGYFTFRTEEEQINLKRITEHLKKHPELQRKLYLIVRCHMNVDELKLLLENNNNGTVERIMDQLDQLTFNGIELRCDDALTNNTKPLFKEFVSKIGNLFEKRKQERRHTCAETVSIRFVSIIN